MQELDDMAQWAIASNARQDEIVKILLSRLSGFEVAEAKIYNLEYPIRIFSLREQATGILFNLIPGGTFSMGFSDAEEQALRRIEAQLLADNRTSEAEWINYFINRQDWYPVHAVSIAPFLLARFPLTWKEAELFISFEESNDCYSEYLKGLQLPNEQVAYLCEEELETLLQNNSHELPTEAQWEYACRAGSSSLFFWGNDLLKMCKWVENFQTPAANDQASNRFGLVNMGFYNDVCADTWHDNYEGAPVDGSPWLDANHEERVVRGGGVDRYPWQNCGEWLSTLPASRSSSYAFDFGVNVRLAHRLSLV